MTASASTIYRDLARGYSIPSQELHALVDAAWTAGRAEEFARLRPLLRRALAELRAHRASPGLVAELDHELVPSPARDDREAAMHDLRHTRYRIKNNEARQRMKARQRGAEVTGEACR